MNPIDPNAMPGGTDPTDPARPKPWEKQPPPQATDGGTSGVEGVDAGGTLDGGAAIVEGAADVVGGVADAAGSVLDGAGGCLDGCSGCSLALFAALFLTAQAALAAFR